ncbi:putative EAL-domain containing protein YkuI [Bacillus sp. THAF10]|uniref:EAL domain-containing protein n=1 Tax=Bacillus sp. THAF10 TaxID=2587848 RepID=UPI00126960C8|nr:EAL domain-containing protein [Bacillus sp. THAF10]QFT88673.1 putative EAL-domain containing protein YkuI [Bacillus sp. THAF10]
MDPLDIMANINRVIPYYQAIFSAEKQEVIGYEVLGRIELEDNTTFSLGSFFKDNTVPSDYHFEVERTIINKALKTYTDNGCTFKLFLNQNVELLLEDQGESLLELFLTYEPKGLKLSNIVIEIDKHTTRERNEYLEHLFNYYKTYGIQVAIVNIGDSGTNMDQIGRLAPNILKVDLRILRQSHEVASQQDMLYSLALLARKIGATLLYHNMEASFQLQYAWRHGGRYYQGFYLHKPGPHFIDVAHAKEMLIEKFQQFIRYEKRKLQAIYSCTTMLEERMQPYLRQNTSIEELDKWLLSLAKGFSDIGLRMYVCDENGFQLSSNIENIKGQWIVSEKARGKNWSWRPYFLEYVMKMSVEQKGILSDLYSDIDTGATVRTYSYPLTQAFFVFIDISYDYLYEHQDLL